MKQTKKQQRQSKGARSSVAKPKPSAFRPEAFRRLTEAAQLEEIALAVLSTVRNTRGKLPPNIHVDTTPLSRVRRDGDELVCGIRFNQVFQNPGTREPIASIEAEYDLFYKVPKEIEVGPEEADEFATRIALFHAWPYFRELCAGMCSKMLLPPLTLPLLKPGLNVRVRSMLAKRS